MNELLTTYEKSLRLIESEDGGHDDVTISVVKSNLADICHFIAASSMSTKMKEKFLDMVSTAVINGAALASAGWDREKIRSYSKAEIARFGLPRR